MSFFNPEKCKDCSVKCLDYIDDNPKDYTVLVKPTNWNCDNANNLKSISPYKKGFYRFNRGSWFKMFLENMTKGDVNED